MIAKPPTIPSDSIHTKSKVVTYYPQSILGKYTSWKSPVKVATVSNTVLLGVQVIDSIQTIQNDRVLVMNQTDPIENGIYIVRPVAWQRSYDLPTGSNACGIVVYVKQGTINGTYIYYNSTSEAEVITGTDTIVMNTLNNSDITTDGVLNSILLKSRTGFIGYESFLYTEDTSDCTMTIGTGDSTDSIITTNDTDLVITTNTSMDMYVKTLNTDDITFQTGDTTLLSGNGGNISLTTGETQTVFTSQKGKIAVATSNSTATGNIVLQTGLSTGTNQSDINLHNRASVVGDDIYYNNTNFETSGLVVKFRNNQLQLPTSSVTIANYFAASPTINTKQGFINITNPTIAGVNTRSVTVLNNKIKIDSIIKVGVVSYISTGIPSVAVYNYSDATNFILTVMSTTATGLSNSNLRLYFVVL